MVVFADQEMQDKTDFGFDRDAYKSALYYSEEDMDSAVDHTYKSIRMVFKRDFTQNYSLDFRIYKSLSDIEKIKTDAEELDRNDYGTLASLKKPDSDIVCDLVVLDGKFGLCYSKYNEELDSYNELYFEERDINLTSDVTLLLDMKERLEKFIDDCIDYDLHFDDKVKI